MDYLLDPELAAIFTGELPRLDLADLSAARERSRAMTGRRPTYEPRGAITVTEVRMPGYRREDDVTGRLYLPANESGPVPALIYLFGGAYVMGSIDAIHGPASLIADRADTAVLTVAYRLAPENPYPAALDDAYAALQWLTSHSAAELGVDTSRVGVLGESAGGGLAAALALVARDRGGPRLTAQFLDAPTIDDRLGTDSIARLTDVPVWQPRNSPYSWGYYLEGTATPGADEVPLYAAPARAVAEDLVGLPPAYVTAYQVDPTRDEGIDYALTLVKAGVATEIHHYAGAVHVTHAIPGTAIGARMIDDRVDAVRRLLHGRPYERQTSAD